MRFKLADIIATLGPANASASYTLFRKSHTPRGDELGLCTQRTKLNAPTAIDHHSNLVSMGQLGAAAAAVNLSFSKLLELAFRTPFRQIKRGKGSITKLTSAGPPQSHGFNGGVSFFFLFK